MDINEYIQQNYDELKKITLKITKNNELSEELFHYCLMILLEYNQDKINEIIKKGHMKYFFVSILTNQWISSTSPFYKQYKKYNFDYDDKIFEYTDDELYDEELDEKICFIEEKLQEEHWYVQRLIEMKKDLSYGQISNITKIPRSSLFNTIKKFKEKIIKDYYGSK